jgi:hypothetical protein
MWKKEITLSGNIELYLIFSHIFAAAYLGQKVVEEKIIQTILSTIFY